MKRSVAEKSQYFVSWSTETTHSKVEEVWVGVQKVLQVPMKYKCKSQELINFLLTNAGQSFLETKIRVHFFAKSRWYEVYI